MPARTVPWDEIRDAQIAKAEDQLRHQPLEPDKVAGGWWVHSSVGDGNKYLVKPKWDRTHQPAKSGTRNGKWWHVLTCNCQAAVKGYMLCWHKAAVFVYWRACKEANRMEGIGPYLLRDGPSPTDPDEPTASDPTPTEAPLVGPSSPQTRPRGTAKKASKPGASVARKRPPKTH